MLDINEVIDSLQNRPDGVEIIITGRAAPSSLVRISQLHSEMRPRMTGELSKITRQSSTSGGLEIYTGEGKGKKNIVQIIILRIFSNLHLFSNQLQHLHNAYDKPFQSRHQQVQSMKVHFYISQ